MRRAVPLALLGVLVVLPLRAQPPDTLTVVTLNLWHDQQDWPRRLDVIADTLAALRPHVVCLQEVLQHEDLPNQARTLAERLGLGFYFASVDPPARPRRYGNAILTRYPSLRDDWRWLDPRDDYRTAAFLRLDLDRHGLDVVCTHLHHTPEGGALRATQVADLLAFTDSLHTDGPLLVAGDLNAAPDAPEFDALYARCTDAYAATHPREFGVLVTTLNPALGHTPRRIDYLFAEGLRPVASRRLFTAPADGVWATDHFGVVARFVWE